MTRNYLKSKSKNDSLIIDNRRIVKIKPSEKRIALLGTNNANIDMNIEVDAAEIHSNSNIQYE